MPHLNETSRSSLGVLAEASAQFHWGTDVEDIEAAARELRSLHLNPGLACQLEAKAARMDRVIAPGRLASAA